MIFAMGRLFWSLARVVAQGAIFGYCQKIQTVQLRIKHLLNFYRMVL